MALRIHGSHRKAIPLSETVEAWLLLLSVASAYWIINSDVIPRVLAASIEYAEVVALFFGMLFTSMLTTAPAIAAISAAAHYLPAWQLALLGGTGAVLGDLLVFRFVRSNLVERIIRALVSPGMRLVGRSIAAGPLWWVGPIAGAIVIASPLPDEVGLLMMGLSHIRLTTFLPLSFAANAAGIYAIATLAQGF